MTFRIGSYHERLLGLAGESELRALVVRWSRLAAEQCPTPVTSANVRQMARKFAGLDQFD